MTDVLYFRVINRECHKLTLHYRTIELSSSFLRADRVQQKVTTIVTGNKVVADRPRFGRLGSKSKLGSKDSGDQIRLISLSMNRLPELGIKRNRNCVSPVQVLQEEAFGTSMCESTTNSTGDCSSNFTNLVWQQWTATFRASRRLKNDLLVEEAIDANVERHMSLCTGKKRAFFDDESDSDDESNYYKLDVPPPQQPRQHPLQFTPSGFLPRLGPQQVTPASYDVDAPPVCSLRRYGHDDEGFGCYHKDDRIPPPPSFSLQEGMRAPRFSIGSMLSTERKEESTLPAPPPPSSMAGGVVVPKFAVGLGRTTAQNEEKCEEGQIVSLPPPSLLTLRRGGGRSRFSNGMGTLTEEKDATSEMQPTAPFFSVSNSELKGSLEQESPAPLLLAKSRPSSLEKKERPNATNAIMPQPLPPPQALIAATKPKFAKDN